MKVYYCVYVVHTKGGKTGATISKLLAGKKPSIQGWETPSTIYERRWFSSEEDAIDFRDEVTKFNKWR